MEQLKHMLEAYRNGERGLPTYAELAAIAFAPQWVSITDRLPDLYVTVALLDEERWMNTGSDDHNVNWHGAGYLCEFGQKYWSVFGETRSQCLDAVTHWMPLPQAPNFAVEEN